jgi:spore coat polysaccharide biosynthesis protein SpsF
MSNKKAVIILSRMDSSRFPGKALEPIFGKRLIERVIENIADNDYETILATTDRTVDDPLEKVAETFGIGFFRGSTENVALRVLECSKKYNLDFFCRANGDSPFFQKEIVKQAFKILESPEFDFCTNLLPRAFPYGVSVEVFKYKVFEKALANFKTANHLEHVTTYFYENQSKFNIYHIKYSPDNDHDIRLVIDTPQDKERIEKLIRVLDGKTQLPLKDIVTAYRSQFGRQT